MASQQSAAVSSNLLDPAMVDSTLDAAFDLGMSEWLSQLPNLSCLPELGASSPPCKKLRLSLSHQHSSPRNSSRFSKPVNSPERLHAAKGVVPANTEASTQWAVRNFTAWYRNRLTLVSCGSIAKP